MSKMDEAPAEVNVGLIGAGFMGKAHSLAYAALPMFFWPPPATPRRHTVVEVDAGLAQEAARRFGFERSTHDWREVIESDEIDLVDISVPNDQHAEIAIAAAQASKHIICEKPLARTVDEAQAMYEAVVDAGVVNMVAFNYRRTPAVAYARELISSGALGQIRNFRGTYLQDWSNDPDLPLSWRFRRNIAGSGALGDIATHVLDLARYLVGEVVAVNAQMNTFIADRPISQGADQLAGAQKLSDAPREPVDVDDEVSAFLRFEGGAVGSLEATRHAHGRKNFLTFEIHGDRGSLSFDYERRDELKVYFAGDDSQHQGFRTVLTGPAHPYGPALWPIPALGIGYGETKIIECYELMKAIADGAAASPDFADGYQIARICQAISDSAESGNWTELAPLVRV
ncbi:MAG TPA: Gfo/Idh/MocA family oxidoreductase [Solirubrobacteraceae bacterium]|jgi:predicted dehydrogenase|nr:Gfo/Idh/MocA family oxidoreductase [Solirubrobacteraceae bacterium]